MSVPTISQRHGSPGRSGKKSAKTSTQRSRPDNPDNLLVCIIDNDAAIRDSLSFLIESDHIPIATFGSAREFLDTWNPERTGCLLIDIRMPGMSGMELQAELARQNISVPLIMITGFGEVQLAVQAMKKGAFDFFEKPIHHQLLLDRLHQALAQESATRKAARQRAEFLKRYESLSKTEKEILKLVVDGLTTGKISKEMACSQKTIESHRSHIYAKLGCKTVAVAVRMVAEQRVFDENEAGA